VKFAIETLPIVLNKHKLSSQSLWMIVLKIVGTILSFYLVPLSINIIGKDNYGYWIVISSFFAWFGFLDFGIGNGLKNRIAEKDQTLHQEQIKHYVSTSYTITVIISIAVILVGVIMSFFVDWWDLLFGNQNNSINNFQGVFLLSFIFTIFILPLKLILSIQHGLQNNLKSSFVNFYQILIVFVFFNIIDHLGSISFGLYVLLSAIIPLLVLTGVNLFEFSSKLNFIRPKLTYFRFDYLKSLFNLSFKFLILQLSVLVLTTTDSILIARFFGPAEVFEFGVASKLYGFIFTLQLLFLTPYWTAFTKSYIKKDIGWIKKIIKRLNMLSVLLILILIFIFGFSKNIFGFWLGTGISIPEHTQIIVLIYNVILIGYAPYNFFINGVGKIKMHTWGFLISALINIPLSLFLGVTLSMGTFGVVLGTVLCLLPHLFIFPYQYFYIINQRGNGVLNQ